MLQKTHRKTAINNVRGLGAVFLIKGKDNLEDESFLVVPKELINFRNMAGF